MAEPTAGVVSTTINLLATMIGLVVLSFPAAAGGGGILVFIVLMIIAVLCFISTVWMLYKIVLCTGCRTYQDTVRLCFGSGASVVAQIVFCVTGILVVSSYIIVATDSFLKFHAMDNAFKRSEMMMTVAACMMPISLPNRLSSLRYLSLIGNLAIVLILCSIIYNWDTKSDTDYVKPFTFLPNAAKQTFEVGPLMAGAFGCHVNAIRGLNELEDRSKFPIVIGLVAGIGCLIYTMFAFAGVAAYGADCAGDIQKELTGTVGMVATTTMGVTSTLKAPLMVQPMREMVIGMLRLPKNIVTHFIMTVALVCVCMGVALALNELSEAVSLLGGTSGVAFCLLIPGAVCAKFAHLVRERNLHPGNGKCAVAPQEGDIVRTPNEHEIVAEGVNAVAFVVGDVPAMPALPSRGPTINASLPSNDDMADDDDICESSENAHLLPEPQARIRQVSLCSVETHGAICKEAVVEHDYCFHYFYLGVFIVLVGFAIMTSTVLAQFYKKSNHADAPHNATMIYESWGSSDVGY